MSAPEGLAARTRVYLVRHGETAWNARGIHQGAADVPLTAAGEAQARALADVLRDTAFDAAYTSDLVRARRTAAIVLEGRAAPAPVAESALRELSYGRRRGSTLAQWRRDDPALARRWLDDPWSVTFPGGESLDDVRRRAVPALARIAGAHRGGTVLVCAHGHVNRVLLTHALGLGRDAFWALPQPNGACRALDLDAAAVAAPEALAA